MVQVIIAIIMMIISYAIQIAMQKDPAPPARGALDVPTAEEGSSVPVLFGSARAKSANVVFSGDFRTTDIRASGGKK